MTASSHYKAGPIPHRRLAELITRLGLKGKLRYLGAPDSNTPWAGVPMAATQAEIKTLIYSPASPVAPDGAIASVQAQGLGLLLDGAHLPERGDQLILEDAIWHIAAAIKLLGSADRLIVQLTLHQLETTP